MTFCMQSAILYTSYKNVYNLQGEVSMMKLGFIGAGNMAKAIMGGVLKNGIFKPEEVIASDLYVPGLEGAKRKSWNQHHNR